MNKDINIMKKKNFKMVVISDLHCGHFSGLTHPEFQNKFTTENIGKRNKLKTIQSEIYNFFNREITNIKRKGKIDILVSNGDIIDGIGAKSGGTELLTTDRLQQVKMAERIIKDIKADYNLIIAGTPYHTGDTEDYEEILSELLIEHNMNSKFGSHEWLTINGKTFDFKHFTGSSSTPHSRSTALNKEIIWTSLWEEKDLIPSPVDYIIRSHVHYYMAVDDGDCIAMSTPALQGFGSKFGSRKCSGIPRIGFLSFEIEPNGKVHIHKHFANLVTHKAKATIFN